MSETPLTSRTTTVAEPPDLLSLVAAAPAARRFFFHDPVAGRTIAAVGSAAEVVTEGPGRIASGSRDVLRELERIDGDGALAVGGFGFSDAPPPGRAWRELPPLHFVIPALAWVVDADGTRLVRVTRPGDRARVDGLLDEVLAAADTARTSAPRALEMHALTDPEAPLQWRRRIEAVTGLIDEGFLRKIVLSRTGSLRADGPVPVARIVAGMCATRPLCRTFWLAGEETSFFGSTPERLVARRGDRVTSMALAGTARRGERESEDRRLGRRLLASKKDRHEHALVVEAVRDALSPLTATLGIASEPELLRLPEAWHLLTHVTGTLAGPLPVLDLAARLHPTPAVCGVPRDLAAAILAREETHRGWYTGGVGWMDTRGDGDVVVALRSALADGDVLHLYAGAGIVAGSDAASELAETETKLTALRQQLDRLRTIRAA